MLSPQEIEKLPDGLAEIWSEFITDSLVDIAERIKKNGELTATAQWRLIKLKELGLQDSYLQKRLAATLKMSKNEMKEMFTSAVIEAIRDDEEILKQAYQAGILNDYRVRAGVVNPIIEKGYSYLNKQTRNFTQSYVGKLNQIYEYALDMAYSRVQSGLMSQQEAVKWTIEDLAKKGIGFITSPSERVEQLETVVARAVRTTVSKTILDAQFANLEALGCDLVETSSHIDSRPSHSEWQGRIFSISGKSKKYAPFKESTGFGNIDGLGGINCRHSFYPYFEGISEKSHKHYKLEHTKEAYEERQKEMHAKSMARKYKREMKVLKAGGVRDNRVTELATKWTKIAQERTDFMAKKEVKFGDFEERAVKVHESKRYTNISTETNSLNAQKTIEFFGKNKKEFIKRYGELDEVVILKNSTIGIAGYDRKQNKLFICEDLISSSRFREIVNPHYFPARDIVDVLEHELGGHKRHRERIEELYKTNQFSTIYEAQQQLEANLRKYVTNQVSYDPFYIKTTISKNADRDFKEKSLLNELVADVKVLMYKKKLKDERLIELVKEVLGE